jgi:hypothetical protein
VAAKRFSGAMLIRIVRNKARYICVCNGIARVEWDTGGDLCVCVTAAEGCVSAGDGPVASFGW